MPRLQSNEYCHQLERRLHKFHEVATRFTSHPLCVEGARCQTGQENKANGDKVGKIVVIVGSIELFKPVSNHHSSNEEGATHIKIVIVGLKKSHYVLFNTLLPDDR